MAKKPGKENIQDLSDTSVALAQKNLKNLEKVNHIQTAFLRTGFPIFDYYFGGIVNVHDKDGNIIRQEPRPGQANGTFNMLVGPSQSGKALWDGTLIPTTRGYIPIRELETGMMAYDEEGKPVEIDGVFPQGLKSGYKLSFFGGRDVIASDDHIWTICQYVEVFAGGERISSYFDKRDVTTRELVKLYDEDPTNVFVPVCCHPIEFDNNRSYEDPKDFVKRHFKSHHLTNKHSFEQGCENYSVAPIQIREDLCREIYKKSHHMTLVNGTEINVFDWSAPCERIFRSLGYECQKIKGTDDKMMFTFNRDPKIPVRSTLMCGYEPINCGLHCTCIHVNSESHLFLTDSFVATHNTTFASQVAANISRQFPKSTIRHFDSEERYDKTRSENITHLPITWYDEESEHQRYFIYNDWPTLEKVNEWIYDRFVEKLTNANDYLIDIHQVDEFNRPIITFQPDIVIIDSFATLIARAFNPNNTKEVRDASELKVRGNGPGDALTSSGFLRNILPLCKKAGIIVLAINHVKTQIAMNMFQPNKKQMPFMNQDDTFPGGKAVQYLPCNIVQLTSTNELFTLAEDGFEGRLIMFEPWKSSYNESGNKRSGIFFNMVFNNVHGFDPIRSLIVYGREHGLIEGNRGRLHFPGHDFTFSMKNLEAEKKEKPIWPCIREIIYPALERKLPFVDFQGFDEECLVYDQPSIIVPSNIMANAA